MEGLAAGRRYVRGGYIPAALCLVAGTASQGQPVDKGASRAALETPVVLSGIRTLSVGPHGVRPAALPPLADACNITSSHAAGSAFNPGANVALQAGMIAGESLAATYVLTAADFPLKVNLTEVLFGSFASIPTTTQWTITYWSGTPTAGAVVATYSSDGVALPHVLVQGGCSQQAACATMLQFGVDPGDPEQIIIADNGSHSFTVAIRIDQFNTPTACGQSPPQSSNAYLCTDRDGLNQGSNNWLGAVSCPLSCPAGWTRFSNLNVLCRPTGDWVSRTTWTSLSCTPGVGACCLTTGQCQVMAVGDCTSQGGTYQGDGSTCGNCPQVTGACCVSNGNCLLLTSANCTTAGGTWQGGGVACNGSLCPKGACCLPSGQCLSDVTALECTNQNGTFRGVGTTCATQCPQPTGGCCLANGNCLLLTSPDCSLIGGTFRGVGTTCATPCPQPTGACCLTNGNCLALTASDCGVIGGTFSGVGSSCATSCSQPCYANCDGSTGAPMLTANDFQCFLDKFAAGATYANCDQSTGQPSLTANDFQCFLNKFAAGCT